MIELKVEEKRDETGTVTAARGTTTAGAINCAGRLSPSIFKMSRMSQPTTNCEEETRREPAATGRPIIAVVGPTASGKSALGLRLALRLGGEVLNLDSVQVYRGLYVA